MELSKVLSKDLSKEQFKHDYTEELMNEFACTVEEASDYKKYIALGRVVRQYMTKNLYLTNKAYYKEEIKKVFYFSMEFLIGKLLESNMLNMGITDVITTGLSDFGIDFKELIKQEPDAGLGNGGLGRLAACFLDSMASISLPGMGIGIRYRYGLFEQKIINGYQVEVPDNWLNIENVWEIRRYDEAKLVRFGGRVDNVWQDGKCTPVYSDYETVRAVPYDVPVPGYDNKTVNTLRLWSAENYYGESTKNRGGGLSEEQYTPHAISQSLYPDDSTEKGRLLRLKQEYFFVSAGLQDIMEKHKQAGFSVEDFDKCVALHINDTHPALIVAELMRMLLDEEELDWEDAWKITVASCAYTNHTILAEALEKWNINMFKSLLPRQYSIIEEINRRFCAEVSERYQGNWDKLGKVSIIQDGVVKMAHLAIVGSHSVNGVAALHTDILKNEELKDFNEFYEGKFNNKTNGITHRRWLISANPELSELITENIGANWKKDASELSKLKRYYNNKQFLNKLLDIKLEKKSQLAKYIKENMGIEINPQSIFDIQVKRLHGYKRQLLNLFNIMNLYNRLIDDPELDIVPRTFIFSAKSFPSYMLAKEIIKLIHCVADIVNSDKRINNKIKLVFIENYGVSLAQVIIPAGDVSEQISTASKEASGTGNMKFMMNGAVTVATLDGANVEIYESVGEENIVLFGMLSDQVIGLTNSGSYNSRYEMENDPRLVRIISQIKNGFYGTRQNEFELICRHLLEENDPYYILKDFAAYVEAQNKIDVLYKDKLSWSNKALVNIANSGRFSSDTTIEKYASEIWGAKKVII